MDHSKSQRGEGDEGRVTRHPDPGNPPGPPPPPSGVEADNDRHHSDKRGRWIEDVAAVGGGEGDAGGGSDLDSVNGFFLRGAPPVVPCSIHLPPRIGPSQASRRPILVGYAFGPKKMSTMGIIMAEASRALEDADYFGGEQEQVAPESSSACAKQQQWTCDQPAGGENARLLSSAKTTEDEATIVTCSTSASSESTNRRGRLQPCRRLTTAALEEENSKLGGSNGREQSRSGGMSTASLCSGRSSFTDTMGKAVSPHKQINLGGGKGAMMTASYFSSAASHYSSCPSVATASVAGGMSGQPPVRVSFVPLDLDCPLEEQHGGNFDVILHKLTEDILSVSKNEDGGDVVGAPAPAASNDDRGGNECSLGGRKNHAQTETLSDVDAAHMISKKRAEERLSRLARYVRENRSCCLVDHPDRIRSLMSRADIAGVLSHCLRGVATRGGIPVRSPRFLVCRGDAVGGYDRAAGGVSNEPPAAAGVTTAPIGGLVDRIDAAPFTYPLIAKPLAAAGTAESHKMVIVLGREGLGRVEGTPCILQEYLNHDGRLFKVYVLGDDVRVFERTSLPNLPRGENDAGGGRGGGDSGGGGGTGCCQFVEFDSQKPYPKLSDFGVAVGEGRAGGSLTNGVDDEATVPRRGGHGDNLASSHHAPIGPAAFVTADEIRPVATALRKAFSLELFGFDVLVSRDQRGCREMLVVDVNYFPSYKEVSNFPSLLAQYLTQRAIGSRKEKRKR